MLRNRAARLGRASAILAVLACVLPAGAGALGTGGFSVSPRPEPGQTGAYFNLSLAPGQTHRSAVIVANNSKVTETLKVSASTGATAGGSGVAYKGAFAPCTGTGCWIGGLPATITVAAGKRKTLPFTITVPAGAPQKQYLAGISVEPAATPRATTLSSNGRASAQAVIIQEVNVGVAVTIGNLADLTRRLTVESVTSTAVGTTPRLLVQERNTGQTFTHARGTASCTYGSKRLTFAVYSDTVLPGEGAQLATNAPGLPAGKSVRCMVNLAYEGGQTASHSAVVEIPKVEHVKLVHTAPGVYSEVPQAPGIPTWAIALVALGGAVVVLLLAVLLLLLRRHRGQAPVVAQPPAPEAASEAPSSPASASQSGV